MPEGFFIQSTDKPFRYFGLTELDLPGYCFGFDGMDFALLKKSINPFALKRSMQLQLEKGVTMIKRLSLSIVAALILLACPALAGPLTPGTWVVLDEGGMTNGEFFTGSWTFTGPYTFQITDLYVVTDIFEVYDNGSLVLTTPTLPDYAGLGTDPFAAPWTSDPDVAWITAAFSKGSIVFGAGDHVITVRDIRIPTGYGDGTVAFRIVPVPEPGLLLLLGIGLVGSIAAYRKMT